MTIRRHIQGANLGRRVTLYQLDLTMFGLDIIYLAPGTSGSTAVSFGLNAQGEPQLYAPHPIKAEGFEKASDGPLPRPRLAVANLDGSFTAIVEQNDDLHGAILKRVRTFGRYLNDGEEPDGSVHLPVDVYELSRKTKQDDEEIQWDLTALMDQEGVNLPGRQMIRDYCDHSTRVWDAATASFDYTQATCPYVGDPKDVEGLPCAPQDEVFSKRLKTCCMARFGAAAPLPTRAFPGVARIRGR